MIPILNFGEEQMFAAISKLRLKQNDHLSSNQAEDTSC